MSLFCLISILAFAQSNVTAPALKDFAGSTEKYVQMLQDMAGSVPAQKATNESAQIADRQDQLTGVLANARRDSRQGEIFTDKVAEQFRKIIRQAFREPGGKAMRKTILERDPAKPIVLKVNEVYPDDQQRTTMPPTLLNRLPVLPKELTYRIIGHAFVLQDTRTNLIVDYILDAIP